MATPCEVQADYRKAIREFGRHPTLYLAVTTFLKKGGFDLLPQPVVPWLEQLDGVVAVRLPEPWIGFLLVRNLLEPAKNRLQITDLSFAIFNELVPTEKCEKTPDDGRSSVPQGVRQSAAAVSGTSQRNPGETGSNRRGRGLCRRHRKKWSRQKSNRQRKPSATSSARSMNRSSGRSPQEWSAQPEDRRPWRFSEICRGPKILALTGAGAAYVAKATIDAILAERAAKIECSISYILSPDK